MVLARGGMRNSCLMGTVSVSQDESVLEINSGDSCAIWKYLMPLKCITLTVWNGPHSVYGMCITWNKSVFTFVWLALEFFPVRSQGSTFDGLSQGLTWDLGYHHPCIAKILAFSAHQGASQVALVVKNPPANTGRCKRLGSILGQEDPSEVDMGTHSSILAWRIP